MYYQGGSRVRLGTATGRAHHLRSFRGVDPHPDHFEVRQNLGGSRTSRTPNRQCAVDLVAEQALQGDPKRLPPSKEMPKLKAELARKEKALAEAAALLVLRKKVAEIWGDEDDDTDGPSDS